MSDGVMIVIKHRNFISISIQRTRTAGLFGELAFVVETYPRTSLSHFKYPTKYFITGLIKLVDYST
jgi:hypothetical protein